MSVSAIKKMIHAEKASQESEEKYRDLVNNAIVGIYKTNLRGDILYVNKALWRMLEFKSQEEMIRQGVLTRYKNPQDREIMLENLKAKGRVEGFETELLTKTGKTIGILLSATLEGDTISGMIMDINERKKAEQALKESEDKFRNLAEKSPNMIFINLRGKVIYANYKCEEVMGYKREEFYSPDFDFRTLIASEFIDMINNNFRRHLKGEEVDPYEYTLITKTGKKIEAIITTKLIDYQGGKAILGIITDITERKRVQEQLQNLSRRLIEVQEAERRSLASDLHDQIGQNLTALSINLNIIRSQFSEEVDKKVVDRIEDSLKLVEATIERTRNMMAGLRPPVLDDYGLVVALRWYTERFSERTGIITIFQEKDFLSCLPLPHETALFRIVQEVLTNVAKHAEARQALIILERVDGMVQLVISDDGVGFDPSAPPRPFKEEPGWGLITMEERAKALGGEVCVKSAPGEGTRVIVRLPC
jgi:PAS domain S-box-containing protein